MRFQTTGPVADDTEGTMGPEPAGQPPARRMAIDEVRSDRLFWDGEFYSSGLVVYAPRHQGPIDVDWV